MAIEPSAAAESVCAAGDDDLHSLCSFSLHFVEYSTYMGFSLFVRLA